MKDSQYIQILAYLNLVLSLQVQGRSKFLFSMHSITAMLLFLLSIYFIWKGY